LEEGVLLATGREFLSVLDGDVGGVDALETVVKFAVG
jgi:hypothetical protein